MPPGDPSRPGPSRPLSSDERPPSHAEPDPSQDLAAALHEVSNALTVLLGWVDAARATPDPHVLATALEIVSARASHARDIARRAIGGGAPQPQPSPLATLVNDAALGLSMEAKRARVTLAVQVAPDVAAHPIPASAALIQILTNLLLNAIAFSPAGSTVRLEALPGPPSRVLLRVDDEGPGIPPEARERLFESGATSRRGGAGIGLRHSAALAASAGGDLRLGDSVRGTRFELAWPIADDLPGARATAPDASPLAALDDLQPPGPESVSRPVAQRPAMDIDGSRILIVEDDDAVIDLLELALEARGASVVSVKVRADLPAALETGSFDAALLDMSPLLGDVEGAVAELRRSNPTARLVVMSGSVPQSEITGAAMWVRKPFEVREIVEALGGTPKAPSKE